MRTIALSLLLITISFQSLVFGQTTDEDRKKAAILVMLDLSPSMAYHRAKLTQLAPLVKEAMENSRCDFKVAVAGIHYDDNKRVSMLPWGEPAWVHKDTPEGSEKINERISSPFDVIFGREIEETEEALPNGGSERTYSSIIYSLRANINELIDMDVVSTLVLSDAAPGYEDRTPQDAVDTIKGLLGETPYVSGFISANLRNGMVMPARFNVNGNRMCYPDFPGNPAPGEVIDTSGWMSPDLESIRNFNRAAGGWQWDVCEPDYDMTLREFLKMIMDAAQCQVIV
ncbi:MAG: hypothetical protein HRT44_01515 [Bdellovibrionales bacterium]|nr:hypothetical protein [Bdellovibrionales bacterium]NQZ17924.1 hypothetical protein [Bdellovibrionales bacterium]